MAEKSLTAKQNSDAARAIEDMNKPLRAIYEKCAEKVQVITKHDVLGRYDLGVLIDQAEVDQSKYGENAAAKLATALGIATTELYRFRNVAHTWTRDEVETFLNRKTKGTSKNITFGHLWIIASVKQSRMRDSLIERFYKEGTTIRDLTAELQEKLGKRGQGTGRTRIPPRGPSAGVASLMKTTTTWLDLQVGWDTAIFENLANEPGKYASKDLVESLEKAVELQEELEQRVGKNKRELKSALDATRRALKSTGAEKRTSTPANPKAKSRNGSEGEAEEAPEAEAEVEAKPVRMKKKKKKFKKVDASEAIAAARGEATGPKKVIRPLAGAK